LEHVAEVGIAGWLLVNMLGVVLVSVGVARRYARAAMDRHEEPTREVPFDPALTLTE
jgi:hypothetical protein